MLSTLSKFPGLALPLATRMSPLVLVTAQRTLISSLHVPKKTKVKVYFDVVSPYSYLGTFAINQYKNLWNLDMQYKPVLLGRLLRQANVRLDKHKSKERAEYNKNDLQRGKDLFQVPLLEPALNFTEQLQNIDNCQRILTAAKLHPKISVKEFEELMFAFYKSLHADQSFRSDKNLIHVDENFIKQVIANSNLREKTDILLSTYKSPETKEFLHNETARALEKGVFGCPTFVARTPKYGKTLFFGSDRLEQLAYALDKEYLGVNPKLSQNKGTEDHFDHHAYIEHC